MAGTFYWPLWPLFLDIVGWTISPGMPPALVTASLTYKWRLNRTPGVFIWESRRDSSKQAGMVEQPVHRVGLSPVAEGRHIANPVSALGREVALVCCFGFPEATGLVLER